MTNGVEGLDKLLAQLESIADLDWVAAEVEGMTIIKEEAKALVPVDTGDLRETIDLEIEGETVNLVAGDGNNVDYALYVEMGTSKMPAQPFMRPAIDTKKEECDRAIARNLQAQIKAKV